MLTATAWKLLVLQNLPLGSGDDAVLYLWEKQRQPFVQQF